MSIVDIVRNIKQTCPNNLTMVKFGKFYHVYGKDSFIIAYMFNYQLKKIEINTYTTGFPESIIDKVKKRLEERMINYFILDKSVDYNILERKDFKEHNTYIETYNIARKYINRKNKIDAIYEYLISNIQDEFIKEQIIKIEDILYEEC